jgi:tetratricopeptide (TPR) repeat protein
VTEAVSSSAIALFLQSARRVRAGFELTAQEVPAALRICRLAEGMPLAIELAAAWVNVLSCQEIAQEIEANLDFLSTSLRDMPARHRSLRTMFDHSWKLLSSEERGAMRHLSIFRGGFKREAAQKVAGASLALLGSLLSKSLLRRSAAGRYDMHELTRQYVLLKLQADEGEHTAARDRHCQYYMARLQDWGAMLSSHTPQEAMHAMLGEMDNLRLAWEWSVRQQRLDLIKNSLRCFYLFFDTRSLYQEATELFAKASQALQDSPRGDGSMVERQLTQGLTLTYQGWFIFRMGRQGEARRLLDGALALLRDLGDWAVCPETLIHNGIVTYLTGDYTAGSLLVNEGLSLAEARQDIWYVALGLSNQGILAHAMGDYESAHDRMLSGLALWKQVGDPRAVAFALNFLSPLLIDMDCLSEADARLHESLALSESIGNRLGMGTAYANMGVIAERRGDLASACALIRQALDIFNDLGAYWDVAWARVHLSRSLTAMGEMGEARRILLDTTRLANQIEAMPIVVDALVGLADLLALEGDAEGALKLAQFVLDQPASKAKTKEFARCLVDRAYGQMAPEQVKAARLWASGQPAQKVVESYLAGR